MQVGNIVYLKKTGVAGTKYPLLEGSECLIGSALECNVRLIDAAEKQICIIKPGKDGKTSIHKLSETFPISINEVILNGSKTLESGDIFRLGRRNFRWEPIFVSKIPERIGRKSLVPKIGRRRSLSDFRNVLRRSNRNSIAGQLCTWKETNAEVVNELSSPNKAVDMVSPMRPALASTSSSEFMKVTESPLKVTDTEIAPELPHNQFGFKAMPKSAAKTKTPSVIVKAVRLSGRKANKKYFEVSPSVSENSSKVRKRFFPTPVKYASVKTRAPQLHYKIGDISSYEVQQLLKTPPGKSKNTSVKVLALKSNVKMPEIGLRIPKKSPMKSVQGTPNVVLDIKTPKASHKSADKGTQRMTRTPFNTPVPKSTNKRTPSNILRDNTKITENIPRSTNKRTPRVCASKTPSSVLKDNVKTPVNILKSVSKKTPKVPAIKENITPTDSGANTPEGLIKTPESAILKPLATPCSIKALKSANKKSASMKKSLSKQSHSKKRKLSDFGSAFRSSKRIKLSSSKKEIIIDGESEFIPDTPIVSFGKSNWATKSFTESKRVGNRSKRNSLPAAVDKIVGVKRNSMSNRSTPRNAWSKQRISTDTPTFHLEESLGSYSPVNDQDDVQNTSYVSMGNVSNLSGIAQLGNDSDYNMIDFLSPNKSAVINISKSSRKSQRSKIMKDISIGRSAGASESNMIDFTTPEKLNISSKSLTYSPQKLNTTVNSMHETANEDQKYEGGIETPEVLKTLNVSARKSLRIKALDNDTFNDKNIEMKVENTPDHSKTLNVSLSSTRKSVKMNASTNNTFNVSDLDIDVENTSSSSKTNVSMRSTRKSLKMNASTNNTFNDSDLDIAVQNTSSSSKTNKSTRKSLKINASGNNTFDGGDLNVDIENTSSPSNLLNVSLRSGKSLKINTTSNNTFNYSKNDIENTTSSAKILNISSRSSRKSYKLNSTGNCTFNDSILDAENTASPSKTLNVSQSSFRKSLKLNTSGNNTFKDSNIDVENTPSSSKTLNVSSRSLRMSKLNTTKNNTFDDSMRVTINNTFNDGILDIENTPGFSKILNASSKSSQKSHQFNVTFNNTTDTGILDFESVTPEHSNTLNISSRSTRKSAQKLNTANNSILDIKTVTPEHSKTLNKSSRSIRKSAQKFAGIATPESLKAFNISSKFTQSPLTIENTDKNNTFDGKTSEMESLNISSESSQRSLRKTNTVNISGLMNVTLNESVSKTPNVKTLSVSLRPLRKSEYTLNSTFIKSIENADDLNNSTDFTSPDHSKILNVSTRSRKSSRNKTFNASVYDAFDANECKDFSSPSTSKVPDVSIRSSKILSNLNSSRPVPFTTMNEDMEFSLHEESEESVKSPGYALSNVKDVKGLIRSSNRLVKSPLNDLSDLRGVRNLLKTPGRSGRTPKNDLTQVRGVKKIFRTPKVQHSPNNDLRDVMGVNKLFQTPRNQKEPNNDLSDLRGVKQLITGYTKSPKNDLTEVHGVKKLFRTLRSPKSPKNDLTNVAGVKRLLGSPKVHKSPANDLTNLAGVPRLFAKTTEPKDDLTDVVGVERIFGEASPKDTYVDVSSMDILFDELKNNEPDDSLHITEKVKHSPYRTYGRKSKSITPQKQVVSPQVHKNTLSINPTEAKEDVANWVKEQKEYTKDTPTIRSKASPNVINHRAQKTNGDDLLDIKIPPMEAPEILFDLAGTKRSRRQQLKVEPRVSSPATRTRRAKKNIEDTDKTEVTNDVPATRKVGRRQQKSAEKRAPSTSPVSNRKGNKKQSVEEEIITEEIQVERIIAEESKLVEEKPIKPARKTRVPRKVVEVVPNQRTRRGTQIEKDKQVVEEVLVQRTTRRIRATGKNKIETETVEILEATGLPVASLCDDDDKEIKRSTRKRNNLNILEELSPPKKLKYSKDEKHVTFVTVASIETPIKRKAKKTEPKEVIKKLVRRGRVAKKVVEETEILNEPEIVEENTKSRAKSIKEVIDAEEIEPEVRPKRGRQAKKKAEIAEEDMIIVMNPKGRPRKITASLDEGAGENESDEKKSSKVKRQNKKQDIEVPEQKKTETKSKSVKSRAKKTENKLEEEPVRKSTRTKKTPSKC